MGSARVSRESSDAESVDAAVLAPEPIERLREMGQALGYEVPRRILQLFLGDAATRLSDLRSSLARGDVETFEQAAHSLKGSSANLGALAFAELCHDLEQRGARRELAGAAERLGNLEAEYDKVEAALRRLLVELGA